MELKAFTLRKSKCFKQASALYTLAWNKLTQVRAAFAGFLAGAMIGRNNWGHVYLTVRGEILGFVKDKLLQKHLPKMFSLIKNES